jgi:hypothetical protein
MKELNCRKLDLWLVTKWAGLGSNPVRDLQYKTMRKNLIFVQVSKINLRTLFGEEIQSISMHLTE